MDKPVVVLDTSFFVDNKSWEYWTEWLDEPENFLLVHVSSVPNEFEHLMKKRNELGNSFVTGPTLERRRLDTKQYDRPLRQDLEEKLRICQQYFEQRGSTLSRTDKLIIQAAYEFAREKKQVYVATADKGIHDAISNLNDADNLSIGLYSPWIIPPKYDIDLLISASVFEKLREKIEVIGEKLFLAVQRNLHIGGGLKFDIASDVYTHKSFVLPQFENAYFIFLANMDKMHGHFYEQAHKINMPLEDWIRLYSHKVSATYFSEYPLALDITQTEKPLTDRERFAILDKNKKRKFTDKDRENLRSMPRKALNWAKIEDKYIKPYDITTIGLMEQFRRNLRHYEI